MRTHRHRHRRFRIRAPLHRKIFRWFGASIVLTGVIVTLALKLTGTTEPGGGGTFLVVVVAASATLWAASGLIARRLGRPLAELAKVASDIGEGKLESRVRLGRHHAGEVGVVADAVNEMAVRIEKQMADQRELLAAVSHEIRTPLAHMRVLVELGIDSGLDPKVMTELETEILEVDQLVGELLAGSRLDFAALEPTELDANDLAARALERAGLPAPLLVSEVDEPTVIGDATLLARALANLLRNATTHGGSVKAVRVQRRDRTMSFEVDDDGPGFSDETLAHAFEAFRRGEGEARHSSLGLGLSLVERIAAAHGGKASAHNLPEGGARVGFEISLADSAEPAQRARIQP